MGLYLRNYEHWVCDTKTTEYTTVTAAVHSFRTVVYLLCGMYSGQFLTCFFVKLPNLASYTLETWSLGLFSLAQLISRATFVV